MKNQSESRIKVVQSSHSALEQGFGNIVLIVFTCFSMYKFLHKDQKRAWEWYRLLLMVLSRPSIYTPLATHLLQK